MNIAWQYCLRLAFGDRVLSRSDAHWNDVVGAPRRAILSRVYVDPIPDLKRTLASELVKVIDGWRQIDVAELLRTDPPRVSDLRRGRLERFSVESLVRFLKRMHYRVDVTVTRERHAPRQRVSREIR